MWRVSLAVGAVEQPQVDGIGHRLVAGVIGVQVVTAVV